MRGISIEIHEMEYKKRPFVTVVVSTGKASTIRSFDTRAEAEVALAGLVERVKGLDDWFKKKEGA